MLRFYKPNAGSNAEMMSFSCKIILGKWILKRTPLPRVITIIYSIKQLESYSEYVLETGVSNSMIFLVTKEEN